MCRNKFFSEKIKHLKMTPKHYYFNKFFVRKYFISRNLTYGGSSTTGVVPYGSDSLK